MLINSSDTTIQHRQVERITDYVRRTLHAPITLNPCEPPLALPVFMGRAYRFYRARIATQDCLIMDVRLDQDTPGDIAKQARLVEAQTDDLVIISLPAMSARDRSRLISQHIPFIVPGNQFYVPALGLDLRDYFRSHRTHDREALSPAAQAVLFFHLLRRDRTATTPSLLADALNYSPMSMGRAFDDLSALSLAMTEKKGRERHMSFLDPDRTVIEKARPFIRSPVKFQRPIQVRAELSDLLLGGETALSRRTDLSPPNVPVVALSGDEWKGLATQLDYEEADAQDADVIIESWSYDPRRLSDSNLVDPLSLYAQFWNHHDERVAMAAEQLLEEMAWS